MDSNNRYRNGCGVSSRHRAQANDSTPEQSDMLHFFQFA